MHTVFIGIGANLGDPLAQCRRALKLIGQIPETRVVATSSFYRSEPLVPKGQSRDGIPPYINTVCRAETELEPLLLMERLQEIEKQMGRQKREKWASRVIDLDLLFYDDTILETPELTIPHPEINRRTFVLKPFAEIAPELKHPVLGKTIAELLENSEDALKVKKIDPSTGSGCPGL